MLQDQKGLKEDYIVFTHKNLHFKKQLSDSIIASKEVPI